VIRGSAKRGEKKWIFTRWSGKAAGICGKRAAALTGLASVVNRQRDGAGGKARPGEKQKKSGGDNVKLIKPHRGGT